MKKLYDIAIIGSGPAGIASAVEATIDGVKSIVIFEKGENHSMTIRKFYKDNKRVDKNWQDKKIVLHGNVHFMDGTKESTLNMFDVLIDKHDIDARFNTEILSIKKDENFTIGTASGDVCTAKNIIIAIGNMGKPNKPEYKIPNSLKKRANHNLEQCKGDEKILVVGGGDAAVEYAYFLADSNDVTIGYRRKKFTRLNPENMAIVNRYSKSGKLRLKLGVDISKLGEKDGNFEVYFADEEVEIYERIIYAIGGTTPTEFLKNCGVPLNEDGKPDVDENFSTSTDGLYVAGDVAVRIGGSIAASLNHAHKIITHIKEREAYTQI